MVNKNKVGNVQFIFGILLLIAAIIGFIISLNSFNKSLDLLYSDGESTKDMPNETRIIYTQGKLQMYLTQTVLVENLAIASLITFLISILFITQGLANKSDFVKGGKVR